MNTQRERDRLFKALRDLWVELPYKSQIRILKAFHAVLLDETTEIILGTREKRLTKAMRQRLEDAEHRMQEIWLKGLETF